MIVLAVINQVYNHIIIKYLVNVIKPALMVITHKITLVYNVINSV
jgi:hypothetical protein